MPATTAPATAAIDVPRSGFVVIRKITPTRIPKRPDERIDRNRVAKSDVQGDRNRPIWLESDASEIRALTPSRYAPLVLGAAEPGHAWVRRSS
jgi:hypothetical protein